MQSRCRFGVLGNEVARSREWLSQLAHGFEGALGSIGRDGTSNIVAVGAAVRENEASQVWVEFDVGWE